MDDKETEAMNDVARGKKAVIFLAVLCGLVASFSELNADTVKNLSNILADGILFGLIFLFLVFLFKIFGNKALSHCTSKSALLGGAVFMAVYLMMTFLIKLF